MLLTTSEKEINEYLEENVKRNRTVDKARITKSRLQKHVSSFDPLTDQEPEATERLAEETLLVCQESLSPSELTVIKKRGRPALTNSDTSTAVTISKEKRERPAKK